MPQRTIVSWSAAVLCFIFSTIACSRFLPSSRPETSSAPSGKIVYQSNQNGNFELYMMSLADKQMIQLTNNSAGDVSPTFIGATNRIGFSSDRQNGWNLYSIDTSGKDTKVVTKNKNIPVDYPSWSPNGNLIAASLSEECLPGTEICKFDIYVMDSNGENRKNLTKTPSASEWVPMWSPDGQKIVFSSDRDGDSEIFVMNKDGSNLTQLTNNKGHDGTPRWSPDGEKIVFETDRDGGDWDLYIMDADGKNPRAVTSNTTSDFSPSWSPDGNWLVYVSNNEGNNELFIIDVNGENQQRLTNNSYNDTGPVWIP